MLVLRHQRLTVFLCSFLGPPPTSSFSGVVAGTGIGLSSGLTETVDHEMDGAFAGRRLRCETKCGQRVGEVSPVAEMQDPMVPVSCTLSADEGGDRCFENTGDYNVPKLHDEFSTAGAGGRKAFSSSRSVKRCSSSTLSRRQLDDARDSARLRRAGGRRTFFVFFVDEEVLFIDFLARAGALC